MNWASRCGLLPCLLPPSLRCRTATVAPRREHAPGRLQLPAGRGQGQLRGGDARETPAGRQAGRLSLGVHLGVWGTQGFAEGAIQT